MAGYEITENNPLILHHIIPLKLGGRSVFENSAIVTNLAHTGIHIVSYDSDRRARDIVNYLLDFKDKPDIVALKQFSKWLEDELNRLDYVECLTKNNILIYRRRNRK